MWQLADGVAVGLGIDELVGAQHAARAGLVVHNDLLTQRFGCTLSQGAQHGVGGATGRPRADVADGLGRKCLRKTQSGHGDAAGSGTGSKDKLAAGRDHGNFLSVRNINRRGHQTL